jgi:hypothetical protein
MSRAVLAIGAVFVIGLGLVLWFLSRPGDNASASTPVMPTTDDPPTPRATSSSRHSATLPDTTHAPTGVITHDHRTGSNTPDPDLVAPATTKHDRDLPSQLTFEVTRGIKVAVEQCASLIPAGERSGPTRIAGSIDVSIRDQVATINTLDLAITGSTGPSVENAKQCVVQKSLGLQSPATDQANIEHYSIEVSFRMP